ncbi:hypothetical protein GCM10009838_13430 [Catenulispora subtropica]|uniref:Uncharacterized protein n=1 Tax=Catenulispora subtropica TaxID=450798 RepID=A0ABP5C8Z7_9ACTN
MDGTVPEQRRLSLRSEGQDAGIGQPTAAPSAGKPQIATNVTPQYGTIRPQTPSVSSDQPPKEPSWANTAVVAMQCIATGGSLVASEARPALLRRAASGP